MYGFLKGKFVAATALFLIVVISTLVLIQLQSQLRTATIYNSQEANLIAYILKNKLENLLAQIPQGEDPTYRLEETLKSFTNSFHSEEVLLYASNGTLKIALGSPDMVEAVSKKELAMVADAMGYGPAQNLSSFHTNGNPGSLRLYIPIMLQGKISYVVRLYAPLKNILAILKQVCAPLLIASLAIVIYTVFFALILLKRVIGPISILNTATKELAEGNYSMRLYMDTDDELKELGDTFNKVAMKLQDMDAESKE